jgi:5'-3' exonuclease
MEKILKKKIPDDVEFTAKEFIMIKILTGDKSDNIPNIMSGIGPVKAYNMVTEKDLVKLKTLLNNDYLAKKQFELNTKLISMKHIPEDIQSDIIEEIKNQENNRSAIIF